MTNNKECERREQGEGEKIEIFFLSMRKRQYNGDNAEDLYYFQLETFLI